MVDDLLLLCWRLKAMARWLMSSVVEHGVQTRPELVAFLCSALVFLVCVTKLVALCAAHSSPQVLNRPESEPEGELAKEAAVAAAAAQSSSSRKLSQRFSPAAIQAKLRDSFRLSSFRSLKGSFRKSSSRSYGSFRLDCSAQMDVVDGLQQHQAAEVEESEVETGPAVWQRAIVKGQRYAPLEFSGLILYDEKGNPLPLRNPGAAQNSHNSHSLVNSLTPSSRPYRSTITT